MQIVLVEQFRYVVLMSFRWTGDNAWLGQNGHSRFRESQDQSRQRDHAFEHIIFPGEIDFGDSLRISIELAQCPDCLLYRRAGSDLDAVGGHSAGGGVLAKFEEILHFLALLRLHFLEDGLRTLVGELGQQIGGGTRIHFFDDVGHAAGIEGFEQGFLQAGIYFFERIGGYLLIQGNENGLTLGRGKVFENVRQI